MAAQRLVRTEANHAANQGELAAYAEEGVERYEYIGTLDMRACSSCSALDGRIFEVAEAKPGVNFPTLHPNCRCTTAPVFDGDDISALQRRARNPVTGKNELVPADMTYGEWKEKYLYGNEPGLANKSDSDDVKEHKHEKPAMIGKIDIADKNVISLKLQEWEKTIADSEVFESSVIL